MDKAILIEYADTLDEVKDLRRRIRKTEDELDRLENEMVADSVTRGKHGKKPLGTVTIKGIPTPEIHQKKSILLARKLLLTQEEKRLLEMQNAVEEYIQSIEDSELRSIFRLRFIDSLTYYQVAMTMNHDSPKKKKAYTDESIRKRISRYLDDEKN